MYAHYAGNHIVRIYTATVGYLNCVLCVSLSDYFYLTTRMKNTMLRAYKRTDADKMIKQRTNIRLAMTCFK